MATINDLVNQIKTHMLVRSDIDLLIQSQVMVAYQSICSRIPFRELEAPIWTAPCTPGNPIILLSSVTPAINGIIAVRVNYTATTGRRLSRTNARAVFNYGTTPSSKPHQYYRRQMEMYLYPTPDAAYDIDILYWQRPPISANPLDTTLLIPPEWDELVIWEALYRIYTVLRRPEDAQALMMPSLQPKMPTRKKQFSQDIGIIPRLWNELLSTVDRREGIDEDFGINPRR